MPNTPKHFSNYDNNKGINTHRATRNDIRGQVNDFNPTKSDSNGLLQTATNIFLYANDNIVGMIQSFSISENRGINKLQSIGYEGVIQAVPSNTEGGQMNVTRIALYESNIWNALGLNTKGKSFNPIGAKVHTGDDSTDWDKTSPLDPQKTDGVPVNSGLVFKTLKDQRVPLEIQVKTRKNGEFDSDFYIDTYIDCWLSSYSKSYSVGTITVAEQATIEYADVY